MKSTLKAALFGVCLIQVLGAALAQDDDDTPPCVAACFTEKVTAAALAMYAAGEDTEDTPLLVSNACASFGECDMSACDADTVTGIEYYIATGCVVEEGDDDGDSDETVTPPACVAGCGPTAVYDCATVQSALSSGCGSSCDDVGKIQAVIFAWMSEVIDYKCASETLIAEGITWADESTMQAAEGGWDSMTCLASCTDDDTPTDCATFQSALNGCAATCDKDVVVTLANADAVTGTGFGFDQACYDTLYPSSSSMNAADDSGANTATSAIAVAAAAALAFAM